MIYSFGSYLEICCIQITVYQTKYLSEFNISLFLCRMKVQMKLNGWTLGLSVLCACTVVYFLYSSAVPTIAMFPQQLLTQERRFEYDVWPQFEAPQNEKYDKVCILLLYMWTQWNLTAQEEFWIFFFFFNSPLRSTAYLTNNARLARISTFIICCLYYACIHIVHTEIIRIYIYII